MDEVIGRDYTGSIERLNRSERASMMPRGQVPSSAPYRFGSVRNDCSEPHVYPGIWQVESTTGPDRLVLAPASKYVDLLEQLVASMNGPFGLLHVLLVSRCGRETGRYQIREPLDEGGIRGFLRSYADYLAHDGRHHTWFFGLGDEQQVIYDNHNLIYCYGDIDRFRAIAEQVGLIEGTPQIPAPHEHRYNQAFDAEEHRIFSEFEWIHFPLEPGDDP